MLIQLSLGLGFRHGLAFFLEFLTFLREERKKRSEISPNVIDILYIISKTFAKISCKNIQPKKNYEGSKLMRLHLFMLAAGEYGTGILCGSWA